MQEVCLLFFLYSACKEVSQHLNIIDKFYTDLKLLGLNRFNQIMVLNIHRPCKKMDPPQKKKKNYSQAVLAQFFPNS